MITYVLFMVEVENDSDKNAGFRGRGRLVILKEKAKSCYLLFLV